MQARLHAALADLPGAERWAWWARQPRQRKTWAWIVPLAETLGFLDRIGIEQRVGEALPPSSAEATLHLVRGGRLRVEQVSRQLSDLPGMLTHNDYGQYNVLFGRDGRVAVIDFDLLCWESPAANLARAISVAARKEWMGPFEPGLAATYLAAYESERPLGDPERQALPALLRLFVLQYVIFHALLCVEECKAGPVEQGVRAMRDDLQRDEELVATGTGWLGQTRV